MFDVESGIPLIESRGGATKYPYALLKVGDSFFIPGKTAAKMSSTNSNKGRQHNAKFVARVDTKDGVSGCRVWRTA